MKVEKRIEETETVHGENIKLTIKREEGIVKSLVFHAKIDNKEKWLFSFKKLVDWTEKEIAIKILKELKRFSILALNYLGENK